MTTSHAFHPGDDAATVNHSALAIGSGDLARAILRDHPHGYASAPARVARPRPRFGAQLPRATGRDPCPHCGTRGDLGCAHLAPAELVAVDAGPPTLSAENLTGEAITAILGAYRTGENAMAIATRFNTSSGVVYALAGKYGAGRGLRWGANA